MAKLKDTRTLKKILLIFLAIQPFLDCYLLYTDEVISFFHFSPTTIIRMFIIAMLIFLLILNRDIKFNRKNLYIYGSVVILYAILHFLVSINLNNSTYKTFDFDYITEAFYIIRMLLPICIIIITYSLKPTKEEIIHMFLIAGAITSIVIVGSNLLVFSRASYGGGAIKGSIIDWFLHPGQFQSFELASKGWFNSANQISGLMFIIYPVCIYSLFEKVDKYRVAITVMLTISMIMLGTRVATYGSILLLTFSIILYLIFVFGFKTAEFKKKNFIVVCCHIALVTVLFIHAPLVNTATAYSDEDDAEMQKLIAENASIKTLLKYTGVDEIYYKEIYPYKDHKPFWKYVVKKVPASKRVGNRNSQTLVTHDVGLAYENITRSFFGLGYSRFISAQLYLEKDFVVHYYTLGILGIILFLCPYIIVAFYAVLVMFRNKKYSLFYTTLLCSLILPLGVSYFSGHIVDELIISLYLGFIGGALLYASRKGELSEKS